MVMTQTEFRSQSLTHISGWPSLATICLWQKGPSVEFYKSGGGK